MQTWLRTLTIVSLALAPTARALAHDPGLSSITLRRLSQHVEFSVVVNHADLAAERRATAPRCNAQGVLVVSLDGRAVPVVGRCRLQDERHTAFEGTFSLPHEGEIALQLGLFDELPRGHRSFARLLDAQDAPIAQHMLTRGGEPLRAHVRVPLGWQFFRLGVEHILMGYDHLLFLAVLLLGVESVRRMAALVSCFTLAHSITLALAALDLLEVNSSLVEASIAASIVWIAARNLMAHVPPVERLAATFGFGLIHGLGFASGLRELGVAGPALAMVSPLLQFNLGVEVGQIAAGVVAVPCFFWLRGRSHLQLAGARAVSGVAAAIGWIWFVQRVFSL
jgi:hydrogenase/urease accessory protein HupE